MTEQSGKKEVDIKDQLIENGRKLESTAKRLFSTIYESKETLGRIKLAKIYDGDVLGYTNKLRELSKIETRETLMLDYYIRTNEKLREKL